jgi:hypothetical protein
MGDIIRGTSSLAGLYRGSTEIQSVYRGTQEIWTSSFQYANTVGGFDSGDGYVYSIGENKLLYEGPAGYLFWASGSNPAGKSAGMRIYYQFDSLDTVIQNRSHLYIDAISDDQPEGYTTSQNTPYNSGASFQIAQFDGGNNSWYMDGTNQVYTSDIRDGIGFDYLKGKYATIPSGWVNEASGYGRLAIRLEGFRQIKLNRIWIGWDNPDE